jgi:pyridoxamine 5'-phosphate oxidase
MTLSTVDADGQPSSRNVLLREVGEGGRLRFFSNSQSRKGRAIADNPLVAALFHWPTMHRQVHVEGLCTPCSGEVSDAYWESRPRDSQLASATSPQSDEIPSREHLVAKVGELSERLAGDPVPRPQHSVMYEVAPSRFEFWQGRPHRLHDRIEFTRMPEGVDAALAPAADRWVTRRLAP